MNQVQPFNVGPFFPSNFLDSLPLRPKPEPHAFRSSLASPRFKGRSRVAFGSASLDLGTCRGVGRARYLPWLRGRTGWAFHDSSSMLRLKEKRFTVRMPFLAIKKSLMVFAWNALSVVDCLQDEQRLTAVHDVDGGVFFYGRHQTSSTSGWGFARKLCHMSQRSGARNIANQAPVSHSIHPVVAKMEILWTYNQGLCSSSSDNM